MFFFETVSNNASSFSPFNTAVIAYFDILMFSLITALAFYKDKVFLIRLSKLRAKSDQKVISVTKSFLKIN